MTASVGCIARPLAAGRAEGGRIVAEQLGYRYFDDEILVLAAEKAQVDPLQLETIEQREGLIARVLDALNDFSIRPRPSSPKQRNPSTPISSAAHGQPPPREEGRRLIREVITEIGKAGNAGTVAHAASIPLAAMKNVLRVLITAPEAVRAQRFELKVRIVNERDALKTIQESDRARLDYLRDFYAMEDESPMLYDLVINTEVLSHEAAARIVVTAAGGTAS